MSRNVVTLGSDSLGRTWYRVANDCGHGATEGRDRDSLAEGRLCVMCDRPSENPHPPVDGQETVTCHGCGHDVSAMDDLMSWDDQDAPDGFYVAHVDCPTDGRGMRI